MTIEQKAREIAEKTYHNSPRLGPNARIEAARLGIIEGRRQAFEEAAAVVHSEGHEGLAAAIRALIEEQKG